MTRSPLSPLNKALFERLKNALPIPVHDHVPSGRKAPYIVLTDSMAIPWTAKTLSGAEASATLKIVSDYQGDKEVAELADKAISAITSAPLVLSDDWRVFRTWLEQHSVERVECFREATILFKFNLADLRI